MNCINCNYAWCWSCGLHRDSIVHATGSFSICDYYNFLINFEEEFIHWILKPIVRVIGLLLVVLFPIGLFILAHICMTGSLCFPIYMMFEVTQKSCRPYCFGTIINSILKAVSFVVHLILFALAYVIYTLYWTILTGFTFILLMLFYLIVPIFLLYILFYWCTRHFKSKPLDH